MPNKPAPVTDADEPERWPQECESVTTSWRMSRLLADRTRDKERIGELECALEAERHEHHPTGNAWPYFCWKARWYARALTVAEPSEERSARLLAQEVSDGE